MRVGTTALVKRARPPQQFGRLRLVLLVVAAIVIGGWWALGFTLFDARDRPNSIALYPYQSVLKHHLISTQQRSSAERASDRAKFIIYFISRNRYSYMRTVPIWADALSDYHITTTTPASTGSIVLIDAASHPPLQLPPTLATNKHVQLLTLPQSAFAAPAPVRTASDPPSVFVTPTPANPLGLPQLFPNLPQMPPLPTAASSESPAAAGTTAAAPATVTSDSAAAISAGYSFWESLAYAVSHSTSDRILLIDSCNYPAPDWNMTKFVAPPIVQNEGEAGADADVPTNWYLPSPDRFYSGSISVDRYKLRDFLLRIPPEFVMDQRTYIASDQVMIWYLNLHRALYLVDELKHYFHPSTPHIAQLTTASLPAVRMLFWLNRYAVDPVRDLSVEPLFTTSEHRAMYIASAKRYHSSRRNSQRSFCNDKLLFCSPLIQSLLRFAPVYFTVDFVLSHPWLISPLLFIINHFEWTHSPPWLLLLASPVLALLMIVGCCCAVVAIYRRRSSLIAKCGFTTTTTASDDSESGGNRLHGV